MRSNYFFLVVVLATGIASSQVSTGTPPFGSFGGGPFDTVNLGNLNVHFAIPVLNKAGRGTAFSYNLSYDSSLWTPVSSNGTTSWVAALNWGWRGVTEVATGYFGYSFKLLKVCPPLQGSPKYGYEYQLSSFVYHDTFGVAHPFPATDTIETGTCGNSTPTIYSTATDGSGYTLYLYSTNGTTINSTVTSRGGKVIVSPFNLTTGPGNMTDANGNQLTANSSGQFFDTLSSTTPVLTVAGAGTPASPMTFTYPAPDDGASSCNPITACASYTMNYTQYTVQTAFGVNNVKEYGPLSNPLVSSIKLPDGSSYTFTYEKTPGSSCTPLSGTYATNCVTGRIASITLPTGGEITYSYSGGSEGIESDGSTATLTRTLSPGGEWQYARSLSGSTWTTTITDPDQNQTAINFAEDGNTTAPTYNFYETQRQVKQLISGTQTLLATVVRCYNKVYANCATAAVSSPITQTDVYSQLPNNSTRLSEVVYNSYGLVTDDREYKYGVTMGSAPGTTDLVRETAISYANLGNYIYNRPASVIVSDWTSGTAATLASTTYSYDGTAVTATTGTPQHTSITGSRGNLTTVTTSTSSMASLSKTFTYYDTGSPYVATDVNGAQTTYVYSSAANPYNSSLTASCGNSFATTINEPLSLSRSAQWNCIGGVSQQVTDENGQIVKTDYTDPDFWRPADVYDQESNETTISYFGETAVEAALQNFNGGNSASDSRTTVDGFGRTIFSQRKQGPSATNYDTGEIDYNNIGQPSRSTMPYIAAASPSSSNTTAPAINTTYDALGRVLTTTDADGGEVAYTYTNNDVLQVVSGTQTFQKQFEYDGLGRLTSVCEVTAGTTAWPGGTCGQTHQLTGYWTTYQYDALGHLVNVTQNAQAAAAGQQTRGFTYDWLGRMLTESNPETGSTGTNGTTTYVYDSVTNFYDCTSASSGDMVEKVEPSGNSVCYLHDALHRVTDIGNSSQSSTNACKRFRFDNTQGVLGTRPTGITVNNTLGRVVEVETDNCTWPITPATILTDEWFSYSPRGETTDVYELTPHSGSGVYYHTTAAYWPTGSLETLSGIPGVPTINYGAAGAGLDGEGRITQVTAASGTNPVTGVTYSTSSTTNPLGALTGVTFGSADSDSFTYDPNTGRMTGYTFSVNGQTDVGVLSWNPNGTLSQLKITDQIPGTSDSQTCNYMYDDLQRISTANCGTPWSQTFTYDPFGNITKSGTLSFIPGYSPTTNQFTTIPGRNVSYDADGNLLTDNLNTYTWDVYGHMSTVNTGSATVTATYDALGRMVENNAGGSYTEFVYGPTGAKLAKVNGTTLIKAFVALPGGAKAIYSSTGLAYYRHSDWLGSSRLTSTAAKPTSVYSSSSYGPFGEQYAVTGTVDASFTGQDQDTVSSLYDFPGRRYSPSQGRWISPDPAGRGAVSLTKPQSWNRYVYVNNNPLALIDPMGLSVRHRNGRPRANTDQNQDPGDDDDDDDDDSSGGGSNDGSDDNSGSGNGDCQYDACVTAPDPGQNPCVMVVGGVDDSTGDLAAANTMGGVASYPLGQDVVGGSNALGTGALGVASVASQGFLGFNGSTNQFVSDFVSVASQNSNVILVGFSGGAQTIATGIQDLQGILSANGAQALSSVTGIALVSLGMPGGFPNTGAPTMVFNGTGVVNGLVGAVNINGTPGTVNPISGCDVHDAGCELFGSNGVLNGVQSDCAGQGGNDATGGSSNVGELIEPSEGGSDRLSKTELQQREDETSAGKNFSIATSLMSVVEWPVASTQGSEPV